MDSPSPLRSSGVPFTFSKFTVEGLVTDIVPAFSTGSAVVESTPLDGVHRRQMPLDSQLVAFD